jgi:hypothetical protein
VLELNPRKEVAPRSTGVLHRLAHALRLLCRTLFVVYDRLRGFNSGFFFAHLFSFFFKVALNYTIAF